MKKLLRVSFAFLLLISLIAVTGCASESQTAVPVLPGSGNAEFVLTMQIGNPLMSVNGVQTEIDPGRGTAPVVRDDRTLMPVRAVVEAMGGTVLWDETTETVTLTCGTDEIKLTIGSTDAYLNGEKQTLDVAPTVIHDRTMLPIRFVAESFGYTVGWEEQTETVSIRKAVQAPDSEEKTEPQETPDKPDTAEQAGKTLIVYFSATGSTKRAAEYLADVSSGTLFELVPQEPYTSEDLSYNNADSRVSVEHADAEKRKVELTQTEVPDWDSYDTVFIGYPIWWGIAAWPVNCFVEANDFSGKTVIPFCTSASSPLGQSAENLKALSDSGEWLEGKRFSSSASESTVKDWYESLGLEK